MLNILYIIVYFEDAERYRQSHVEVHTCVSSVSLCFAQQFVNKNTSTDHWVFIIVWLLNKYFLYFQVSFICL